MFTPFFLKITVTNLWTESIKHCQETPKGGDHGTWEMTCVGVWASFPSLLVSYIRTWPSKWRISEPQWNPIFPSQRNSKGASLQNRALNYTPTPGKPHGRSGALSPPHQSLWLEHCQPFLPCKEQRAAPTPFQTRQRRVRERERGESWSKGFLTFVCEVLGTPPSGLIWSQWESTQWKFWEFII